MNQQQKSAIIHNRDQMMQNARIARDVRNGDGGPSVIDGMPCFISTKRDGAVSHIDVAGWIGYARRMNHILIAHAGKGN